MIFFLQTIDATLGSKCPRKVVLVDMLTLSDSLCGEGAIPHLTWGRQKQTQEKTRDRKSCATVPLRKLAVLNVQ
jgi:hypothetical protein